MKARSKDGRYDHTFSAWIRALLELSYKARLSIIYCCGVVDEAQTIEIGRAGSIPDTIYLGGLDPSVEDLPRLLVLLSHRRKSKHHEVLFRFSSVGRALDC